jgi:ABC-type transport system involved in cytochrome c biogenesis permease subunit
MATAKMLDAYRAEDSSVYNQALHGYGSWLDQQTPSVVSHVRKEFYFNHVEPFYRALVLYLGVFFLVLFFWLSGRDVLRTSAFLLLVFTFAVHTTGLIVRMVLHGRPPVTNLYSSAIFVGWVAVLLGIFLERFSKKGWGSFVSALIGFSTLIIAHNLASQGDTLEMMRAVLDSNFWLATHVVSITVGYGSTFLSGALGILYIARRLLDRSWTPDAGASLERMGYGVVCFSLLFSFVGTILGGIWADQSWGRFWGWDPKENGALMIVLWNAFILHARWGKMVSERSLMAMMVFGNVITALSWFGVNMLGIGLHSYGFMDKAFFWLVAFVLTQFVLIAAAFIPVHPIRPKGRHSEEVVR